MAARRRRVPRGGRWPAGRAGFAGAGGGRGGQRAGGEDGGGGGAQRGAPVSPARAGGGEMHRDAPWWRRDGGGEEDRLGVQAEEAEEVVLDGEDVGAGVAGLGGELAHGVGAHDGAQRGRGMLDELGGQAV